MAKIPFPVYTPGPFALGNPYADNAFMIPDKSTGLNRDVEATPEEVIEIQTALTALWEVARINRSFDTMLRVKVVKNLNLVFKYINEDKVNAFECKSVCEIMIRIRNTFLEQDNVRKALYANIEVGKLFKKAFIAQRSYPNFDFANFAMQFKQYFGSTPELERYLNVL